ncbi:MAG: outer membrane protein assembly factor BamE [Proteobacteria bacterium]|nr:outer membrane protein assembly factor BamE [Pseudomonadota bacterium]
MKRIIVLVLPSLVALAGCSSMPDTASLLTPYRINVRQGNFVTPAMVAQLKPGQTRDQVRFILGTPLVADPFHADRWDYIYRFQPGHGEVQQRRLAVYFAEGKLTRYDGDVVADPSVVAGTGAQPSERVIEVGPRGGPAVKPESAGK